SQASSGLVLSSYSCPSMRIRSGSCAVAKASIENKAANAKKTVIRRRDTVPPGEDSLCRRVRFQGTGDRRTPVDSTACSAVGVHPFLLAPTAKPVEIQAPGASPERRRLGLPVQDAGAGQAPAFGNAGNGLAFPFAPRIQHGNPPKD